MNIRPMGTELFHAGGRTDRYDEANSSQNVQPLFLSQN